MIRAALLLLIGKASPPPDVRHSRGGRRITLGADKGYDAASFVADMRALNVTPHIAQNISGRRSAVDARTTRHPGYAVTSRRENASRSPLANKLARIAWAVLHKGRAFECARPMRPDLLDPRAVLGPVKRPRTFRLVMARLAERKLSAQRYVVLYLP